MKSEVSVRSMRAADTILTEILTGKLRPGQRIFCETQLFESLLIAKVFADTDYKFNKGTNSFTLNGVKILRSPQKLINELQKGR